MNCRGSLICIAAFSHRFEMPNPSPIIAECCGNASWCVHQKRTGCKHGYTDRLSRLFPRQFREADAQPALAGGIF